MKKLINISLLIAALCFAAPVYADGDMSTGTKTCTQNCGGLAAGTNDNPTVSNKTDSEDSPINEFYSWIHKQISELLG